MITNQNRNFLSVMALVGALLLPACDDIIERDISNAEVILIAPGDNLRTAVASQTFWWETIDGARTYNLQIVSPSFESVEIVLADTILTKNRFDINLFPGKFEWRLRAQNGSYETNYAIRSLEIDSTLDLKAQKIALLSPSNESFLNNFSVLFKWQKLYNADNYSIEIHNVDWSGITVYSLSSIISDTISVRNLKDGEYMWGIKGWNRNSATDFSTRKIVIDKLSPSTPGLLTPLNKATFHQLPVNLTWSRVVDQGSPISDSLIISSDSLFTKGRLVLNELINATKFDNAVSDTGTYYWRVKSVDAAHNQGSFSEIRRFTVLSK